MTHHNVETAELLDSRVNERLDVLLLRNIALDGDSLRGGEARLDLLGGLLDRLGVHIGEDDTGALSSELQRSLETDAAGMSAKRESSQLR